VVTVERRATAVRRVSVQPLPYAQGDRGRRVEDAGRGTGEERQARCASTQIRNTCATTWA
jgi:hypothetical protein